MAQKKPSQPGLFDKFEPQFGLPEDYRPSRPRLFNVERIFLAKGSLATASRARFVERICGLYPEAEVVERLDTPHNRIDLQENESKARVKKGKQTLVFGEHKSAVRFSREQGNSCPNYWHFSPYGFCFYECKYCYLSGTRSFWHAPAVKIFVNLEEILFEIDRVANRLHKPAAFYIGKLQDGLALDPLSGYSSVLIPFFARHPFARQTILTKSGDVDGLLNLEHNGHTILSWSLNPPEICTQFEENVPSIEDRVGAMQKCAACGYPVRAVIMPVIPAANWEAVYERFLCRLLERVNLDRLTLGGVCIYRNARRLMEAKLGSRNAISDNIDNSASGDGRARYSIPLRLRMYSHIIRIAKEIRPGLDVALCLEEYPVWRELNLEANIGCCNCVL